MNTQALNILLDHVVERSATVHPRVHGREWSAQEDQFLRDNLGYLTDVEMAAHLGRTEVAVHLRWKRDLFLPSPSKSLDVLTANQAAKLLGIDGHKTAYWVDAGLIPGRMMAGGRSIRLIKRETFRRWVLNPMNWPYFDIRRVKDPELKRMLGKRAVRWGDEWWSTRKAADYHGVTSKDIVRHVKLGRIHSFHLPVSLGGRHSDRGWSNHFVLKSEVVAMVIHQGRGNQDGRTDRPWTPAADAWLLKARDELGMTFVHIGKTMKIGKVKASSSGHGGTNPTIAYRYHQLKAMGKKAGGRKQRR